VFWECFVLAGISPLFHLFNIMMRSSPAFFDKKRNMGPSFAHGQDMISPNDMKNLHWPW